MALSGQAIMIGVAPIPYAIPLSPQTICLIPPHLAYRFHIPGQGADR